MSEYSRANPSPRYRELIQLYRDLHTAPVADGGKEAFPGLSLDRHAGIIRSIIEVLCSETILDYGSGKGRQYEPFKVQGPDGQIFPDFKSFWGVSEITCYDPAYPPFSTLPEGRFDGVVCTDVMEHCPEDDLDWIVDEIFGYAREFAFINVACHPADRTLPNGENAHCTVHDPDWWLGVFDKALARHPGLRYYISFHIYKGEVNGQKQFVTEIAKRKG